MSDSKKEILVISNGKKYAVAKKSVSWLSPKNYYLGDFDYVVIDTTVLNTSFLERILKENKNIMNEIKEELKDTLLKGGSIIFCFTSPNVNSETRIIDLDGEGKVAIHNYSWCPIIPVFRETQGEKFLEEKESYQLNYFKQLGKWTHFFEGWYPNFKTEDENSKIKARVDPMLRNKNQKMIAFRLSWAIFERRSTGYPYSTREKDASRPIVFIPPVTEDNNSIELLLSEIAGDGVETPKRNPSWKSSLILEGEKKLTEERKELEKTLGIKLEEFKKVESALEKLTIYKDLLTESGVNLENITEKALDFLGLKVKKVPGYKEDRKYEIEGYSIPIEIRGKENKPMSLEDLRQLISRKPEEKNEEYINGVFFFNHFLNLSPDKRPPAFSKDIIDEAVKWKLSLVTTYNIFNLTNKKLRGESVEEEVEGILTEPGEFKIKVEKEETKAS